MRPDLAHVAVERPGSVFVTGQRKRPSRNPALWSTTAYALATTATRNPALVLAAGAMGTLFGMQRRATGGVQAPILTHLTWAVSCCISCRHCSPRRSSPESSQNTTKADGGKPISRMDKVRPPRRLVGVKFGSGVRGFLLPVGEDAVTSRLNAPS